VENQQSSHLEIAEEMLSDAQFAFKNDMSLRTVEDRAFYSMYHATMHILEKNGNAPKTQSGAITLFGKHEVKEKQLVDPEYHRMLSKYQAKRQEADYEKVFLETREDAKQFLKDAEGFLNKMEEIRDKV